MNMGGIAEIIRPLRGAVFLFVRPRMIQQELTEDINKGGQPCSH